VAFQKWMVANLQGLVTAMVAFSLLLNAAEG